MQESVEFVGLAPAHAHTGFEPGAQLCVVGVEEGALVASPWVPADLAANRFMHCRDRLGPVLAQHPFERLQLVFAVDRKLLLAEATAEAIWNTLCGAETMVGFQGRTVYALPQDELVALWQRYQTR